MKRHTHGLAVYTQIHDMAPVNAAQRRTSLALVLQQRRQRAHTCDERLEVSVVKSNNESLIDQQLSSLVLHFHCIFKTRTAFPDLLRIILH
jgi:hypothetical protein